MFNIEHCVYYSCCMNGNCPIARACAHPAARVMWSHPFASAGSGHVSEDDAQPMHLCPVDLHKLYHALGGFDVEDRLVVQPIH
jgi:hypothetical protein